MLNTCELKLRVSTSNSESQLLFSPGPKQNWRLRGSEGFLFKSNFPLTVRYLSINNELFESQYKSLSS